MQARNENNPYHRYAEGYERNLGLPIVSTIRRQEARLIRELISRYCRPESRALEVGPGTGFYTKLLAQSFRQVVAVEDSAQMAQILSGRLGELGNVTVLNCDFISFAPEESFDVAVAIGVLDYVADPAAFVGKMCSVARRAVIFTTPQRGLWGCCFAAGGRLRKINVYCRAASLPPTWAPEWRCEVTEVGLKTPLTKGLTLVAVLEPR